MKYKKKLIFLGILLNILSNNIFATERGDSELIVSGSNMWERIEGTVLVNENCEHNKFVKPDNPNPNPTDKTIDHYLGCGKNPIRAAVWGDNGAIIHNLGTIKNSSNMYESQFGSLLGIGWVNNPLKKTDNLVYLDNATLYNDGSVMMKSMTHTCKNILSVVDLAFYRKYADYQKNVILAENSKILNSGTIATEGDTFQFKTIVGVDLLKYNEANYTKSVINMTNSNLKNTGRIEYGRDKKPELLDYVGVGLVNLGIHYNRDVAAVRNVGGAIENTGDIFVGGDFVKLKKDLGGIHVDLIGADLVGDHKKYGVKSDGGTITNTGNIEVERNYTKGLDADNTIIDLRIAYGDVLGLGLLNFDTFNEKSVGVAISNGKFINNGGNIKVGVNHRKNLLDILHNAAIGIEAHNKSNIDFNGGKIKLEGTQVWAASLNEESKMTFRDKTEIIYQTKDGGKEDVNNNILGNDGTGSYIIKGDVLVRGETEALINDSGNIVKPAEKFDANLHIGTETNLHIGIKEKKKIVITETGKKEEVTTFLDELGKLEITGTLSHDKDATIKFDTQEFIDTDWKMYVGDVIIVAKDIPDELNVISDSHMFTLEVEGTTTEKVSQIIFKGITRKNFNDIVLNKELGNIFETSYDGANEEQLAVYKLLAKAENQESFNKVVDEVTGKDTLTTLPAQIYDITRDLNGQFKDFAKNNRADGVVFKYINSKSELDANSSTVGFDRKSSGIMVGYNNNLSEKLRLGAGFSYMTSDIDYTSNSKNKITTWNARGYSDYDLGFANMFNDLSFAYNQSENKRMADQLSYTGMKESDTDVYTLSLNNSLYKEYKFGDKLTLVPSLNLDFTYVWQDAIEEDGVIGASAKKVEAFYGTLGAGVDGKYNLLTLENSKLNLVGGIDYAYDIIRETDDMSLQVSAFDPYYKENLRELDKKYLDLNVGLNYEYKDSYSVGVKYTKELINDVDNDQFAVDFTYKF